MTIYARVKQARVVATLGQHEAPYWITDDTRTDELLLVDLTDEIEGDSEEYIWKSYLDGDPAEIEQAAAMAEKWPPLEEWAKEEAFGQARFVS